MKGICQLCGQQVARERLTKHVQTCLARQVPKPDRRKKPQPLYQVQVDCVSDGRYFLQLEVGGRVDLNAIDHLLRGQWLGDHWTRSAILSDSVTYASLRLGTDPLPAAFAAEREKDMLVACQSVLAPGRSLRYLFDPERPLELALEVVGVREGLTAVGGVQLVAVNVPPEFACGTCGQPARFVCPRCRTEPAGWCCVQHASDHACGSRLLPVANSPLVGTAGIYGPADPASVQALSELYLQAHLPLPFQEDEDDEDSDDEDWDDGYWDGVEEAHLLLSDWLMDLHEAIDPDLEERSQEIAAEACRLLDGEQYAECRIAVRLMAAVLAGDPDVAKAAVPPRHWAAALLSVLDGQLGGWPVNDTGDRLALPTDEALRQLRCTAAQVEPLLAAAQLAFAQLVVLLLSQVDDDLPPPMPRLRAVDDNPPAGPPRRRR